MITHSSILAWKIQWTEESGGLQSMGSQRSEKTKHTQNTHTHTHTQTQIQLYSASKSKYEVYYE